MFASWIIRAYTRRAGLTRSSAATLQGVVSIVLSLVVALGKAYLALRLHSLALWADVANTASDSITSLFMVAGFRAASSPPDRDHPYGHGRAEELVGLLLSLVLVWSAIELISSGWHRVRGQPGDLWAGASLWMLVVLTAMAVVKEWLARFALHLGQKVGAPALVADAWHHRVDGLAGAAVVVGLLVADLGYPRVDGWLAMGIAGLMARTGVMLGLGVVSRLLGERPSDQVVAGIGQVARGVEGVEEAHQVRVHHYGHRQVISLNIHVAPRLSVERSHSIATEVERRVSDSLPGSDVVVHVEPGPG